MNRILATGGAVLAGVALAVTGADAAPITFSTALPVAEGSFVLREQAVFARASDDPSGLERGREAWAAISVLGYGARADLTFFVEAPLVERRIESAAGGGRRGRSARGLGDVALFTRYTAYRRDRPGRTFRVAPYLGVKTPTGRSRRSDSFGRLPPAVQSGTGSWDPFGGVVLTYQTLAYQLDAQAAYRVNTRANGFEFGDVARADASLQVRLWPRHIGDGTPGFLYGVAEANLSHRGRNRSNGTADKNSGGFSLFLSPGLQYVTRRWIVEVGAQLPVVQQLNGTALRNDFVLRFGFRVNF